MRSFLRAISQDAVKESNFSKRLRRMHQRINLASLASFTTLATSYLIITYLVCLNLGRQSSDFNAIAQVFCSMAPRAWPRPSSPPFMAVAMSCRMQSAFFKVFMWLQVNRAHRKRGITFHLTCIRRLALEPREK